MGMYEDIINSINREQRDESQWASPLENLALEIPKMFAQGQKERRVKHQDRASNLMELYNMISNETSIDNFQSQVSTLAQDTQGDSEMLPIVSALQTAGQTKREDFEKYKLAINDASEFMSDESFADTQADFLDLQNLAKNRGFVDDKTGKGMTLEFIINEKSRINSMLDGMRLGIDAEKGVTKFRYNNNSNMTDMEAMRKLSQYSGRLDIAVATLGEDGVITPMEAQHILIGDMKSYQADKDLASKEAIANISEANDDIDTFKGLLRKLATGEDTTEWLKQFDVSSVSELKDSIQDDLLSAQTRLKLNNKKYKAWVGRDYLAEGEGEDDSLENLLLGADKDKVMVTEEDKKKEQEEVIREEKKAEISSSETGLEGSEYNVFSTPTGIKEDKSTSQIADALGEDNYQDVKKKYMRVPYDFSDYWMTFDKGQYKASDIKIEDATKNLETVLDKSNISIDDMSMALSKAPHDIEERLQGYIDTNYPELAKQFKGTSARELLYHISKGKLYKKLKGPLGAGLALGAQVVGLGRTSYAPEFGGYFVKDVKRISPKEIKKIISSHDNFMPKYEQLSILYSFLGQELKVGSGGELVWKDGTPLQTAYTGRGYPLKTQRSRKRYEERIKR